MAVKINRSLDAVRICCAVGIGHVKILKWRKTGVESWVRYSYIDKVIYATTSSCLTSAQVPCIWSYVTSRLSIVLMTSPPCNNTVISQRVFTGKTCWRHVGESHSRVFGIFSGLTYLWWSRILHSVQNVISMDRRAFHPRINWALWTSLTLLVRFLTDEDIPPGREDRQTQYLIFWHDVKSHWRHQITLSLFSSLKTKEKKMMTHFKPKPQGS